MNRADRVLIIGGGPAGLSTARAYRENGGRGRVTILTTEPHTPYRRPPLTKEYLRGEAGRDELPMQEARWFTENGIELRTATRALSLDPEHGVVTTDGGEVPFDACVLATGSEPARVPVPGGDDPELLVIRTVEDSERLRDSVGEGDQILVIGSGFIGCEAAVSLSMRGARVALVSQEASPQEQRLGPEVGARIEGWLEGYGVDLQYLGTAVEGIERHEEGGFVVSVAGGESIPAGTVFLGTGVTPRTGLAREAGLEMEEGGVVTDSSMRTSAPGVFAVGDIVFGMNESAGARQKAEHWGDALEHGRIAGTVLAGGEASWSMAPGFWSTMGEKTLKYWSWSGGWDEARFVDHAADGGTGGEESFTVWYGKEGVCVGVLAHNADGDYERGRGFVEGGALLPR